MLMLDYMEKHEDFDRYITGKMSDEERKSFNEEIEKDVILRAELHLREDLSDGIKRRAEKLEKIQSWEKSYTKEKNGRIRRLVWSSVSVAAAVVTVICISLSDFNTPSTYMIGIPEISAPVRGASGLDVKSYWDEGRYEDCLQAIQKALEECKAEIETLKTSGLPTNEIEYKEAHGNLIVDDLQWAKILTLIKMGKTTEAAEHLNEYIMAGGNNDDEAKNLLHEISIK